MLYLSHKWVINYCNTLINLWGGGSMGVCWNCYGLFCSVDIWKRGWMKMNEWIPWSKTYVFCLVDIWKREMNENEWIPWSKFGIVQSTCLQVVDISCKLGLWFHVFFDYVFGFIVRETLYKVYNVWFRYFV